MTGGTIRWGANDWGTGLPESERQSERATCVNAECLKTAGITKVGCQLSLVVGYVQGLALRCCLGLGLALGFGVGGGVALAVAWRASARVCGIHSAALIPGQIQHQSASLTPGMDMGGQQQAATEFPRGSSDQVFSFGLKGLGLSPPASKSAWRGCQPGCLHPAVLTDLGWGLQH